MSWCVFLRAIQWWLAHEEVMLTFVFSTDWVVCPCPSSVESGISNSKRPTHRTPAGCKQTVSQTTWQPIKMPQLSPQELDKPRNKGPRKPEIVFSSWYQQARATMSNSKRCQGYLLASLQFLAWSACWETEGQEKEKKWPGGISQN